MKRIAILFCVLTMLLTTTAYAKTMEFVIGSPEYSTVENAKKTSDKLLASPFIQNDRTMIPVRAITENFGSKVDWDGANRLVTIQKGEDIIILTIDSTTALVNGKETALDAPPCIVGDTTFVPVRFVSESLNYYVNYVPRTKSVLVCDKGTFMTVNGTPISYPEYETLLALVLRSQFPTESVTDYVKDYLIQNTLLANAAISNSIGLSAQKENYMTSSLDALDPTLPILKGSFALLLEAEQKGIAYLESVVKEADVERAYKENYICAKHILISGGTDSENQALAKKVYEKAIKSDNFDILIAEYGSDPGVNNAPNGYVFTKGDMVSSFETASYGLKENEISKPVKSEFGYHIIKRLPLPELSDEIAGQIQFKLYVEPLLKDCAVEYK